MRYNILIILLLTPACRDYSANQKSKSESENETTIVSDKKNFPYSDGEVRKMCIYDIDEEALNFKKPGYVSDKYLDEVFKATNKEERTRKEVFKWLNIEEKRIIEREVEHRFSGYIIRVRLSPSYDLEMMAGIKNDKEEIFWSTKEIYDNLADRSVHGIRFIRH